MDMRTGVPYICFVNYAKLFARVKIFRKYKCTDFEKV